MRYEAIHERSSEHRVGKMCKILGVSQSGYYKWKAGIFRREQARQDEAEIVAEIWQIYRDNQRVYGYRRISEEMEKTGKTISIYKVRRLMREQGIYPEIAKKNGPYPKEKEEGRYTENLLKQNFEAKYENQVWVGDITYLQTATGWVYLAVVMDLFNREVVGYALSKKANTELTRRALANALAGRKAVEGMIFHSDRGCQYSGRRYQDQLEENGIIGSMSKAGCPYDNACAESFFATLKKEFSYKRKYVTMEEIEMDMFEYIELFYNRKRMHGKLGYLSPVAYRMKYGSQKVA